MASQPVVVVNEVDDEGYPAGGFAKGNGVEVTWQNGSLGAVDDPERQEPNGAFVEDLLTIALNRLNFYQTTADGSVASVENRSAIESIEKALYYLEKRTRRRTEQGVEGTHQGN